MICEEELVCSLGLKLFGKWIIIDFGCGGVDYGFIV